MATAPMGQNQRAVLDRALWAAKRSAYPPGEFVGQESFMRASEILSLARTAGVRHGVSVLDVCAGVGGPGLFVTRQLACRYVGIDVSAEAIDLARERTGGLRCEFLVASAAALPRRRFDVVMLLETMLAFAGKGSLLTEIASVLPPGGRFAFTVEEGEPLSAAERRAMPRSDTVHLLPLETMHRLLARTGFVVRHQVERTAAHRAVATSLSKAYQAHADDIRRALGEAALAELLASHRLWSQWLGSGRARKFELVAERR